MALPCFIHNLKFRSGRCSSGTLIYALNAMQFTLDVPYGCIHVCRDSNYSCIYALYLTLNNIQPAATSRPFYDSRLYDPEAQERQSCRHGGSQCNEKLLLSFWDDVLR